MSKQLILADLHLTDNPIDDYRWDIFPWLREQIVIHDIDIIYILGDITEKKDKHSAKLLNRIFYELICLQGMKVSLYILKGNHDYIDTKTPFFLFLDDVSNGVHFINAPRKYNDILFLPHTKNPIEDWKNLDYYKDVKYIFMHQHFQGAVSNGYKFPNGVTTNFLPEQLRNKQIISGDIHTPQKLGNILYVGAPYHINFGDTYKGRCILMFENELTDLCYDTVYKHSVIIEDPNELDNRKYCEGDFIKVQVNIAQEDSFNFMDIKKEVIQICKAKGLIVQGVSINVIENDKISEVTDTENILEYFSKKEKLSDEYVLVAEDIYKQIEVNNG